MIDAGLPLVQCLDILCEPDRRTRSSQVVLRDIKSTVEQGATFSDALRRHPKIFDELFVNLVQAGEVGGILDTILNRLAVYIEKRVKLAPSGARRAWSTRSPSSSSSIGVIDRAHDVRHPGLREHVHGLRREGRAARGSRKIVIALSQGFVELPAAHHRSVVDRRRRRRRSTSTGRPTGKRFFHSSC